MAKMFNLLRIWKVEKKLSENVELISQIWRDIIQMINVSISEFEIVYNLKIKLLKKLLNSNMEEFSNGEYS